MVVDRPMAEGEFIYVGRNESGSRQDLIEEWLQFVDSIGATVIIAPDGRRPMYPGATLTIGPSVRHELYPGGQGRTCHESIKPDDQCRSCRFWCGQTHNGNTLVCAVHPNGVEGVCGDREV